MNTFKLNKKNQVILPKRVMKALKLETGDKVYYNIFKDGYVGICKAKPLDEEYYKMMQLVCTEWDSPEDEEAFAHLQD